MKRDDIEFDVIGIAEMLSRDIFVVPSNQREYSWISNIQVKSFMRDINNAMRDKSKTYFLGTVVLTKGKDDILEIADGQQRLSTTTMVISAIRDYFAEKGYSKQVNSIETDFLSKYDREKDVDIPRLTLNVDDNHFFSNTVVFKKHSRTPQVPARRSHKLIVSAYDEIKLSIKTLVDQYGDLNSKQQLNDIITYLRTKCMVVKLVVDSEETAFTLFETLNDRGLKTSQADLVKNFIFKLSDNRILEAQKLWSSMRGAVESISDKDDDITMEFLRIACCVLTGPTEKRDVFKTVQNIAHGKSEAIQILTDIERLSRDFAAVLNSDHEKWNSYPTDIRYSITTLNILGVAQIRPLLLATAMCFNEKNASDAFKMFLSWSVRFNISGVREGNVGDNYSKLAFKIYSKDIKNVEQLRKEAESIVISDTDFKIAFSNAKVSVAKTARYYLRSLERTAQGVPDPEFVPNDDKAINLEHIMPEKPSVDWNLTQQDLETYCKRIGNLALLQADKNNKIGNDKFSEKKEIYKQSTFLLTSQIAELDNWDADAIDNRQKKIAELAVKTWPL
jgi:hypothetical protein